MSHEDPDWSLLADGRVHRLSRGRHFSGDPRAVVTAARAAAEELGKVALTAQEDYGKYAAYVWVQFADGRMEEGAPCSVCGSTELLRAHPTIVRCVRCGARLVLVEGSGDAGATPVEWVAAEVPEEPGSGGAPAVAPVEPEHHDQLPQARFHDADSLERLEFYDEIRIKAGMPRPDLHHFVGWARVGSKAVLLRVHFFPDRESPDLGDHRVTALPVRPYGGAIDISSMADWQRLTIGPRAPEGTEELVPIHPYFSLCRPSGDLHVPVVDQDASR